MGWRLSPATRHLLRHTEQEFAVVRLHVGQGLAKRKEVAAGSSRRAPLIAVHRTQLWRFRRFLTVVK